MGLIMGLILVFLGLCWAYVVFFVYQMADAPDNPHLSDFILSFGFWALGGLCIVSHYGYIPW